MNRAGVDPFGVNPPGVNPAGAHSLEAQALLDATVDAVILIDHRGSMQVFNRAAERLFGYGAAETLGRNVSMLMTERDRDQHDGYLTRYLRTGVAHIIGLGREVQARRKDGSVFPALLSVGRIGSDPPRFVGFIQDMTLRQQALAALERERERANRYLEAAQTMLVGLDAELHVTMINRKGCEVLGRDEAALLGTSWPETVVPAGQRARLRAELDALLQQHPRQPRDFECPVLTAEGATRQIVWRCVVIEDAQGAVGGVLCSGDDVTDSRRAEQEVREARERIMHVSRLATMGEMASGISHELNQPLAAIATYAQAGTRLLALADPDIAEVREALQQIAEQALRAGEIIRRLRSLVRNRSTSREWVDLNEVIRELEPLTRADARASDVRVVLVLDPALPRAHLDPIQMQQVVLNLLRNGIDAVQSLPSGQREVHIRTHGSPAGQLQIQVLDNGAGVPEALRAQLFTPFLTTKPHGTGLGLAISRSIVEAHRGRLEFQPNEPRGAVFTVTLPGEMAGG
ncbi:MAG TPA: PAS domain S-box protein [Steroidobacteraceae bacterium]|nr:PAS domain S-box protein [Steroidobacteraceae bacterium]